MMSVVRGSLDAPLARSAVARPYGLFFLFALYGPSIDAVGQLRYVEVVVLVLLALNLSRAIRSAGVWERRLAQTFLIAALAQIVSDVINGATLDGTIKRSGTYIILALLVIALRWLGRNDPTRILFIVVGYCASYVFILFIGTSSSAGYAAVPWRLGLGVAANMALCCAIAASPTIERFGTLAQLGMAILHVFAQGRSMALNAGATALFQLGSQIWPGRAPSKFRLDRVFGTLALGVGLTLGAYFGAEWATENKIFPGELQAKMEEQFANPYGILAAGRPDTVAAIYAISKQPIFGYGSTNFDPDVYAFYSELASSSRIQEDDFDALYNRTLNREWTLGTPSHSHLFGAWADAGIAAAVCWVLVLYLSVYVLSRSLGWSHAFAPLFVFVAVNNLWDVLFSPGPHRMDMAVRLMILCYAADVMRSFDFRGKSKLEAATTGWRQSGFGGSRN